ncbi:hypothetical protein F5884DRAFT_249042 [Xylogone sp. PMI_703]|nr:hypothetical protein F5884DRAFT_249042 [Xylogone sp. PMI_703]
MDYYNFMQNLSRCRSVEEKTSYLEMFSYSDTSYNTVEEHPLPAHDMEDFLHRTGDFQDASLPKSVTRLGGLRLIIQRDTKHPEAFTPLYISLKPDMYKLMVETFHLPYRLLESSSCVGPFFWSAVEMDDQEPYLKIIYRKADVRKLGTTRGYELILSHDIISGITSGFYRGSSSDIGECLDHVKACVLDIAHPMLLPTIILNNMTSMRIDMNQRDNRDMLRGIENSLAMRGGGAGDEWALNLDAINQDLVDCRAQVLRYSATAYIGTIDAFKETMRLFMTMVPETRKDANIEKIHSEILYGLEFHRRRLIGIESYVKTTLERIDVQRNVLYNLIAEKESKLNFMMAGDSRKIAYASKRDSATMKTIALLGVIFLPGTFLASIFSTTFFNFQTTSPTSNSSDANPSVVSPKFWIYWAISIPVTLVLVGLWYLWERHQQGQYRHQDLDIENGAEFMEKEVMAMMQNRVRRNREFSGNEKIGGQGLGFKTKVEAQKTFDS